MPDSRDPRLLRQLANLLIRGPDAPFIVADLDDAMERELARGVPLWRARWRYAANLLGSAFNVWRTRWRMPRLGVSWIDVKLGLRMLMKHPGLTIVAIFALAVGIPVGLVPAHATYAFLAPPPVEEADRIRMLKNYDVEASELEAPSLYDFTQWRRELTAFEALGATTRGASYNVLSEDGRAAPVQGAEVTAFTFDVLRVRPLLGRTLVSSDETIGAPAVVVLGYDLWQSRLDGDTEVVGRAIRIGGVPHTVVGVMPEDFHFPYRDHLWLPLRVSALDDAHGEGRTHLIFGRLSDGVSPQEAQAELTTVGLRMTAEVPDAHARLRPEVVSFTTGLFGFREGGLQAEPGFYAFQLLALLVLVVACANIGMLILARTATRSGELAVRAALGASRTRIVSQMFTESLVLAVVAAGIGLLVADQVSSRLDWMLRFLPYWIDFGVTGRTVLWALSLAVFSAAVVGVVPALKVTGKAVQRNLQRAGAGRSGVRFGGISSALIVADVALAVATIGVAAGFSNGLTEFQDGMGVHAEQFLSAELRIPRVEPAGDGAGFDQTKLTERVGAAHQGMIRRLEEEPGVRGVAIASVLPGMDHRRRRIELEGENGSGDLKGPWARYAHVDVDFFDALEQPILTGRGFDLNDVGEDRSAVIVNSTFVDQMLGGRNPIGRRLRYETSSDEEPGPWYEIVGVVGHLGMNNANPGKDAGLYHPVAPGEVHPMRLAVHVGDDPESFTPRLRALASEVDPTAIISRPVALNEVFYFDGYLVWWMKLGAGVLTGILLALSALGIYALMSFTVAERTREIGIRAALGAQRGNVMLTTARRALAQLGLGILLGMAVSGRLLFELKRDFGRIPEHSPFVLTLILGIGVMVLVGTLACIVPTLRALRILPTEALRGGG